MSNIIYAANEGLSSEESWTEIVDLISRLIPSENSAVVFCAPESETPRIGPLRGFDDSFAKDYAAHYYKVDDTLGRALELGLKVYRAIDVVPLDVFTNSEIYVDFLRPHGVSHSVLTCIGSSPSNCAWLALGRGERQELYTDAQMEVLGNLQKHLTQAFDASRRLAKIKESIGFLDSCLEQFGRPVLIFEDDCRLMFINASAREFCEGRISTGDNVLEGIQRVVGELIERAVNNPQGCSKLVFANEIFGNRRCIIEVSPVYHDGRRRWIAALVDITEHLRGVLRRSAEMFRLTSREIDICEELMRGLSNREIAEKLFITEFTVKDHFKSITNKLQISNRTELAIKLLGY
jgi:DNA-binding CsgD family transcriptional regulator